MQSSQELLPVGWEIYDRKNRASEESRRKRRRTQMMREVMEEKRRTARKFTWLQGIAADGAVLFFIGGSILLLNQSQQMTQGANNVSRLAAQYEQLVRDNDALENKIRSEIDYGQIYRTAVDQLGMSYPDSDQVVKYERGNGPYVYQEEALP